MKKQAQQVLEEALRLSTKDRAKLAAEILSSVDGAPDPDAEAAWAAEIEARAQEALSGKSEGVDWETVRENIEAKLGK